jgi:hypothetical protein
MFSNMRHNFSNLAEALLRKGKSDSAGMVLDKCLEVIPDDRIPFDVYMLSTVETFYKLNEAEKARNVASRILENTYQELDYFISLDKPFSGYLMMEKRIAAHILSELISISHENGDKLFSAEIHQKLESYGPVLNTLFR